MELNTKIIIIVVSLVLLILLYVINNLRSKIFTLEKIVQEESENKILLEHLPIPVFYKDKNSKIIYKNRAFSLSFGINEKQACEKLSKYASKTKEQMSLIFDNNIKKQTLVLQSSILNENKELKGKIGTILDITNFKKDINALIKWKKRYNLAVEGCGYGIWDWDITNNNIYFSSKWKETMGYENNEEINSLNSWLNLVDARDMARVNEALNRHLNGKSKIFVVEHRLKLSKKLKWINIRGKALFDHNNTAIRMTGQIIDITDKKELENKLNKSQKLFAIFMDNLPAIAFIKDIQQRYIYMNHFYENYIGFKEWKNKTPNQIFDKGTAAKIIANDRRAFYEGVKKYEEMIPNEQGTTKYFEAYKFPIDNGNDEKLLCGFSVDITQEKIYKEKIRLYAEIFNNTSEGILVTDNEQNIMLVNKAFEKTTGYTSFEVIGKHPSFLKSDEQDEVIYNKINKSLEETGHFSGEIINMGKKGNLLPTLLSINNIKNEQGKITNYFFIFQNIEDIKANEEKLKKLASYDVLTKLPNRFLFKDRLKQCIANTKRSQKKMALVFVDLDDFKLVNDTLGHDAGDLVLTKVAEKLSQSIRENDTVARLGGDEFVIILEDIKDTENLNKICQKILSNLNTPFQLISQQYQINASLGASIYPDHARDHAKLLKLADKSMYEAKNSGKNTVAIYGDN
jgi:diguanylate cyclase (GGDEF)-like protein/PAS domain S-box-containing protein